MVEFTISLDEGAGSIGITPQTHMAKCWLEARFEPGKFYPYYENTVSMSQQEGQDFIDAIIEEGFAWEYE